MKHFLLIFTFAKQKGIRDLFYQITDNSKVNLDEVDLPTDLKDLPFYINWNADLPSEISVPRVDLHSMILDFSAVSFLDISGMNGLKMVKTIFDICHTW